METNREAELLAAQHAAEWLERLKTAGPQEQNAFLAWLKQSRLNVRELLLAKALDEALNGIDPEHRMDIGELMGNSSTNVRGIRKIFR